MRELEELEEYFREIKPRLTGEEPGRFETAIRHAREASAHLEAKYLDAIRDRAIVHSLLEKTSADLFRRYKAIFEYSGTAMAVLERDGTISLVNSYFVNLAGYPREEIEGHHSFSRYVDAGLISLVGRFLEHAGDTPPDFQDYGEGTITARDGRQASIVIRIGRFPESGQCALSIIDITERRKIEDALGESQRMLATAMDLANVANWEFEPLTGQFVFNDRFYTMYGTTAEREGGYRMAPERYIREFVYPDDQDAVIESNKIRPVSPVPGDDFRMEHRIVRRDGEVLHIVVTAGAKVDKAGQVNGILGATQDITDRKRAEETLRQVNRKLNLLSGITRHDIKNQLLALNGFLAISKEYVGNAEKISEFIEKEMKIAKTMERQIAFTKEYEAIGMKDPAWQDCHTLIETAARQASLGKVLVRNDIPAGLEVFADPLIVKVFYNLIDNAVRHGGKITTIRFFIEEREGCHRVVCEDDGAGVPAEEKERMFERGFGKNTGVGLFLSTEILSISGITITETGEPGKGARFEINVPKGTWRLIPRE
jgi:PAS domain S-box-containing protein